MLDTKVPQSPSLSTETAECQYRNKAHTIPEACGDGSLQEPPEEPAYERHF